MTLPGHTCRVCRRRFKIGTLELGRICPDCTAKQATPPVPTWDAPPGAVKALCSSCSLYFASFDGARLCPTCLARGTHSQRTRSRTRG